MFQGVIPSNLIPGESVPVPLLHPEALVRIGCGLGRVLVDGLGGHRSEEGSVLCPKFNDALEME